MPEAKGKGLLLSLEWREIAICSVGDELDDVQKTNIKIIDWKHLSFLPLFFVLLLFYLAKCFDLKVLETKQPWVCLWHREPMS